MSPTLRYIPTRFVGRTGEWKINWNPPPIPCREFDYEFYHEDYDGAPMESGGPPADNRCGHAASIEACIEVIKELEEESDE